MDGKILIIDDEEQLRKLLRRVLSLEGYTVSEAGTLLAGERLMEREPFDILLCDVKLPDGNGVEFVSKIRAKYHNMEVILLTAYGNIPDGVMAIKNGAFDYLTKGNDNDRIIPLIEQAMTRIRKVRELGIQIDTPKGKGIASIITSSRIMEELKIIAAKAAAFHSNILIMGETGTGKEVMARAIHDSGTLAEKPFIAINCSAFSKDLLEAELFGYKAGAFTGANRDKKGLIEMANGGTLFLDEIGEMDPDLQTKLLRFLESGEFYKLGEVQLKKVKVRLLSATNRDLEKQVESGHFRNDLFYRLNTITLHLPPLRDRKEDIPLLCRQFISKFVKHGNSPVKGLTKDALKLLQDFNWKGNIRELQHVIERAVVLADGDEIQKTDLPAYIQEPSAQQEVFSLADIERIHIKKILERTGHNKTRAAELLGIGLATLYRKLEEYKLHP